MVPSTPVPWSVYAFPLWPLNTLDLSVAELCQAAEEQRPGAKDQTWQLDSAA